MRLRPEAAWVDGTWRRGVVLRCDGQGAVQAVGPGGVDATLWGCVMVPGLVDACALHPLALPGEPPLAGPTAALARLAQAVVMQPRAEIVAHLCRRLRAALAQGITTVGLPHLSASSAAALASAAAAAWAPASASTPASGAAPAPALTSTSTSASVLSSAASALPPYARQPPPYLWTWADAVVQAAQAVGMRVALLDVFAARHLTSELEASLTQFDGLVRHLLAQPTALVSWGLLLAPPTALAFDALISLRLRLAHLPVVLMLEEEAWANHPARDGAKLAGACASAPRRTEGADPVQGASWLAQALASEALDACCALGGSPLAPLDPTTAERLRRRGSLWLHHAPPPPPKGAAQAGAAPPALAWATASGLRPLGADAAAWRDVLARFEAGAYSARRAASALGLVGGTLRAGTWADFVLLRPPPGVALPATDAGLSASLCRAAGAVPLRVWRTYVAGRVAFDADA